MFCRRGGQSALTLSVLTYRESAVYDEYKIEHRPASIDAVGVPSTPRGGAEHLARKTRGRGR